MSHHKIVNIHHAAFATANIDKTIEYWRDLLGFKLAIAYKVWRDTRLGKQYFFALNGQIVISFFEWDGVAPMPYKKPGEPVTGSFGFDHLAFQLADKEALLALQNQLIAAELPVSDIIDHGFIHSIYTYDPNHIAVEFCVVIHELTAEQAMILDDDTPSPRVQEGALPIAGRWVSADETEEGEVIIVPGEGSDLFKAT